MTKPICPRCKIRLIPNSSARTNGRFWYCQRCFGRFLDQLAVRNYLPPSVQERINLLFTKGSKSIHVRCPDDRHYMMPLTVDLLKSSITVDACSTCKGMWFDRSEAESLIQGAVLPIKKRFKMKEPEGDASIDHEYLDHHEVIWSAGKRTQLVLGLHVPENGILPGVGMIYLISVISMSSVYFFKSLRNSVMQFGFDASHLSGHGITWITNAFVHGGVKHLLFNMYFMFIAGSIVENELGIRRTFFIFFISVISGNLVSIPFTHTSPAMHIGASGGIAGLMLAAVMISPNRRLSFFPKTSLNMINGGILRIYMPIWTFFVMFIFTNVFNLLAFGNHGTSFSGHVGGVIGGAMAYWLVTNFFHDPE